MIPLVVDTGVLVKFVVVERESPNAVSLLRAAIEGTYALTAPDFLAIEFGNVLWKYVRRGLLKVEDARRHVERFPFEHVRLLPARTLLVEAFGLADKHDIAVYDGAFLAAAVRLQVEFVTADEALHRKVSGRLPWVKLLRDFEVLRGSS